jgi:hypothetical protein
LAKKYGILKGDESLDKMTLQQYLDLYKESLSEKSMEAILNLTEVAVDKEKKKKKKQKRTRWWLLQRATTQAAWRASRTRR